MPRPAIPSAEDPVSRHIGFRIRRLRKSRGVSQQSLGSAVGVSLQQIQKYEKGVNRISAPMLYGAAIALGAPLQAFHEGLPDPADEARRYIDRAAPSRPPAGERTVGLRRDLTPERNEAIVTSQPPPEPASDG
jgi:transcriptional regulator with XRE-family HTH domain